jgi:crotonobetainyl-CoA:carnitine CoA-transferase CaiB-like acyl-CoA transferase
VRSSDILIQNFRPGVMQKFGFTFEALHKINPRLVYASLSGFGATGPKADLPGVNMIALAMSGLAATTMTDGRPPSPLGFALCDVVASMWAAYGILAAYSWRLKTGRGQEVDTSLIEAGISLMVSPVAQYFHANSDALASNSRNDGNAPSGFFKCADGMYIAIFASYPALWDRFVAAMGLQHLAESSKFKTRDQRTKNAAELHKMLVDIFKEADANTWVERLVGAGIPASVVNDVGRMIKDEQVMARQMIVEQDHPTAGKLHLVGLPVKLSETPGAIASPAPSLGENTEELLRDLGHGDEIGALRNANVI